MYFFILIAKLLVAASALGTNRQGSPACHFIFSKPISIIEILAEAVWSSGKSPSTVYRSGDHVACIATGVCLFLQGATLTLEQIYPLINAVLEHGCQKCGSVPIHFVDRGSNDPRWGILTFNYVGQPICTGNCIQAIPSNAEPSIVIPSSPTGVLDITVEKEKRRRETIGEVS